MTNNTPSRLIVQCCMKVLEGHGGEKTMGNQMPAGDITVKMQSENMRPPNARRNEDKATEKGKSSRVIST